tara:strand:- start:42 stop:416 length:375 start_codon:yes stop_codon:yes gene_type:complete
MNKSKRVYEEIPSKEELIFDTILYKGVKFKGKRSSGKYYYLTKETKDHNSIMRIKSDKLSSNYKITFGKYKGKKMLDMNSKEEYSYCTWFYKILKDELSKSEKKKSRKYKSFSWCVRKNKPSLD